MEQKRYRWLSPFDDKVLDDKTNDIVNAIETLAKYDVDDITSTNEEVISAILLESNDGKRFVVKDFDMVFNIFGECSDKFNKVMEYDDYIYLGIKDGNIYFIYEISDPGNSKEDIYLAYLAEPEELIPATNIYLQDSISSLVDFLNKKDISEIDTIKLYIPNEKYSVFESYVLLTKNTEYYRKNGNTFEEITRNQITEFLADYLE